MLKQILEADALLVCASEPRHVPGKLFEALRTGNPIIAIGGDNAEVKEIIESAKAGMMFGYEKSGKEFFENLDKIIPVKSMIIIYQRYNTIRKIRNII